MMPVYLFEHYSYVSDTTDKYALKYNSIEVIP